MEESSSGSSWRASLGRPDGSSTTVYDVTTIGGVFFEFLFRTDWAGNGGRSIVSWPRDGVRKLPKFESDDCAHSANVYLGPLFEEDDLADKEKARLRGVAPRSNELRYELDSRDLRRSESIFMAKC